MTPSENRKEIYDYLHSLGFFITEEQQHKLKELLIKYVANNNESLRNKVLELEKLVIEKNEKIKELNIKNNSLATKRQPTQKPTTTRYFNENFLKGYNRR